MMHELTKALMGVLDIMFEALHRGGGRKDAGWNLMLTLNHIHLIPRSHATFPLTMGDSDKETKTELEVNALGYAGMLLAKSDEELEAIIDPESSLEGSTTKGIMRILEYCGIPRDWAIEPERPEGELAKAKADADADADAEDPALDSAL